MSHDLSLKEAQHEWHGTLKSYLIGFFLSLLLTSLSFYLVTSNHLSGHTLIYTLISLAGIQALVQLLLFLHIGQEPKPRWETFILCFTIVVLLILVLGSLWIMHDLDERVMANMVHQEMAHD